jgi:hypothetical protein
VVETLGRPAPFAPLAPLLEAHRSADDGTQQTSGERAPAYDRSVQAVLADHDAPLTALCPARTLHSLSFFDLGSKKERTVGMVNRSEHSAAHLRIRPLC